MVIVKMFSLLLLLVVANSFYLYKLPSTGTPLSARQLSRLALDKKNDKLLVFGGSSEGSLYFDDLWEFDIQNRVWTKITPVSDEKPEARIAFCMFGDSETSLVYLFGGENKLGYLSDMWVYYRDPMSWSKLTTKGATAPAFTRFAYTSYRDSSNKLKIAVTYGETMTGTDKNVYVFDVETWTWTKNTSNGDPPQHDVDSEMTYYNGKLYLYGGRNTDYNNDLRLYSYDFTTQTWSGLTTTNSPKERETHGTVVYGDYLYVLPGWTGIEEYDDGEIKRINLKTGSTAWETLKIDSESEAKAFFPRDSYGYVITGSLVYFSCGFREDGIVNNVVTLDLSQSPLKYEVISENFESPPSRTNHSILSIGTKLYMFGGKGTTGK
jgi:hypothetical protein